MQLSFFRFTLIISLLTSSETKLKNKSRNISSENKEMNFKFSKSLRNLTSLKNKYSSREINFPKSRHGRTTHIKAILSNPKLSATQILAEKLAKEALESPKMQKEFKKLTIIKSRKRNSRDIRKNPKRKESVIRSIKATKGYYKPLLKDPKKKKRKKHKCGFGSFKKVPSKIREEGIFKLEARNPSLKLDKASDYSRLTRKTRKAITRESMLERVMQTTTKDPKKKNPGDQGVEYSEYYNDDDTVNDPVEKIQTKDDDFKSSITRFEREIADKKTNIPETLQKGLVSLNQDDELEDDVENEDELYGNESDGLLSEKGQRRHKNQVYQQNLINQQRKPTQRNQIYPNVYQQNPYILSDPEKYRQVQQQVGLIPNPQFLFPNQYSNQFQNRNQVLLPVNIPLNQSKKKVQMKNNQNFKGSNYKPNLVLVPVEESPQLYSGIEMTSLNSTIFESTTVGSSAGSCSTVNQILNNLTPSQNSGQIFGIPGTENSKKGLDETLAMKYNPKPMNSFVPLVKGNVTEHQNQQLNTIVSKEDTQVIANEILNKIVDELEELKLGRSRKSQKEGKPCRLSGSWNSTQAGVKLNMKVVNYTIAVNIEKLEPLPNHEGLLNTSWNLSGQVPFRHGGPFSLIGVNNKTKSLAVFLGSCRICQGVDTIEGIWTISREPHDCRDFQMATGIYNDIFRRIKLHNDKRKKEKSSTESSPISNSTMNKS